MNAPDAVDLTDPVIIAHVAGLPVTTITSPDGGATRLVPVLDYLTLEDERDDLRRACALINAWSISPDRPQDELRRILYSVGFDMGQARATAEILAQVRDGSLMRSVAGE